jgi:hypothetical protein
MTRTAGRGAAAREGRPPGPAPASSPLSRTTLVSLAGLSLAVVAEACSVGLLGLSGLLDRGITRLAGGHAPRQAHSIDLCYR